jgi:hypothetical protein
MKPLLTAASLAITLTTHVQTPTDLNTQFTGK